MLFSKVRGQQWIGNNKTCRQIAGDFDFHAEAAVRRGVHHLIGHIQNFAWSHWMPPLGKFLCCIALAAAMVDGFVETTLNTNKTQLLPRNYGTFWALVNSENFNPITDPLLSSSMRRVSFRCETPQLELKSLQSFLAIKHCQGIKSKKVSKLARSLLIKVAHICANRGIPVNPTQSP